jgi:hypothetical protein
MRLLLLLCTLEVHVLHTASLFNITTDKNAEFNFARRPPLLRSFSDKGLGKLKLSRSHLWEPTGTKIKVYQLYLFSKLTGFSES